MLKIMLIQQNPTVGDIKGNLALAKTAIIEAEREGADIVVFSELFICGYPAEDLVAKFSFIKGCEQAIEELVQFTKSMKLGVLIGSLLYRDNKLYNSVYFIEQGRIVAVNSKQDLPNYAEFDEKRNFTKAERSEIISYKSVKIGIPICEDVWNEPDICASLVAAGAELIIVANASPYRRGKPQYRVNMIANKAAKNKCPIIYVNQLGGQDEIIFDGASFACDSSGSLVYQAPHFAPKNQVIEIDVNNGTIVVPSGVQNHIFEDKKADYHACILGIKDYMNKNGFQRAVIGLSGGLDSAISAAIVADAIGAEKLSCYMLRFSYTSQQSLDDAKAVAENIGCAYHILDIKPAVESFCQILPFSPSDICYQNLQSRTRGVILMAISNQENSLLITTGNKSEMAVGYATIYGDMNGGYNPIKDLYKTEIYALARWRNENLAPSFAIQSRNIIPDSILEKPASAELADNQKDEDSLPPYEILDAILYQLIERDNSVSQIVQMGYNIDEVKKVEKMLYHAEYKRFQSPPGVRLSKRNLGSDRRYPITNKFRDN